MPSFADSIVIFVLALMLFGPKKLPQLAKQLGKLMAEFRRASNDFRMQMEDELRIEEQKEHQKKVEELPGPNTPVAELPSALPAALTEAPDYHYGSDGIHSMAAEGAIVEPAAPAPVAGVAPIAESGGLKMMPPSTGLPVQSAARGTAAAATENTILPPGFGASSEELAAEAAPQDGEHATHA